MKNKPIIELIHICDFLKWKKKSQSLFLKVHKHPIRYDEKRKEVIFKGELWGENDDIIESEDAYRELDKFLNEEKRDLKKHLCEKCKRKILGNGI